MENNKEYISDELINKHMNNTKYIVNGVVYSKEKKYNNPIEED